MGESDILFSKKSKKNFFAKLCFAFEDNMAEKQLQLIAKPLVEWYEENKRTLP